METAILTLLVMWWLAQPDIIGVLFERKALRGKKHPKFLEQEREGENGTVDYFISGILMQPRPAFNFMLGSGKGLDGMSDLEGDSIVLVPYGNAGVNFWETAEEVVCDILRRKPKKVRIFGISIGCELGRYIVMQMTETQNAAVLEAKSRIKVELIDINPCWSRDFLNRKFRRLLPPLAVVMKALVIALGVIGYIPMVPTDETKVSLRTLSDQLWHIAMPAKEVQMPAGWSEFAILSNDDQFLNNVRIRWRYRAGNSTIYNVSHGDTIGKSGAYAMAIREYFSWIASR